MIIYTCRNFYELSCRWTRDDIYIPQLYINFSADEHVIIYTCRNSISIFLQMNTLWYIHTATLYQLSCRWTRDNVYIPQTLYQLSCSWAPDDIYIPQLFIDFPAHKHVMIYIYTATLYLLFCRWTRGNIYIPQHYINFSVDEHVKIYANRNFISTVMQINTWQYKDAAILWTFLQMKTW